MSDSEDPAGTLQPLRSGKPWELPFAYAYTVGLIAVIFVSLAAAIYVGIISLDLNITVSVNLGWVIELLVAGFVIIFLLFTFIQIVRIAGIGFIRGVIRTIARIAHNYELPTGSSVNPDSEEDQES